MLVRQWESADRKKMAQVDIPKSKNKEVRSEVRGGMSGGHLWANKTMDKVREPYYWLHFRGDVERWCRQCETCAASQGPRSRSQGLMRQHNVGAPFERITVDIAGPFPESDRGNRYLLVATDFFTKWLEFYAIPNQEASTVVDVLVSNFFCHFGIPMELHSDQGRNFESRLVREVLEQLGIHKTRTTPLHPQSDGMVEWYVKTIEEHLRKVVSIHKRDWDEGTHLPAGLPGVNTRQHRCDICQHGVCERTSPVLRPDVRGSPRQGTVGDRLYN